MYARIIKEPLTIFAAVAASIFIWDLSSEDAEASSESHTATPPEGLNTIRVPPHLVSRLAEQFAWREGREPDATDTQAMLDAWIADEMLFRLALQQGMHLSDGKMREHLVEKMRLLWAGVAAEPDEAQLVEFYVENMDRYWSEPRISFEHIFFRESPADAKGMIEKLQSGETIAGDDYWLGNELHNYAESILRNSFGGEFYGALAQKDSDEWFGPLESPRGYHFIRVTSRQSAAPLPFKEVHERVYRDWQSDQLRQRIEDRTNEVRSQFAVVSSSAEKDSQAYAPE